jgi:hypothetical protein
MSKYKCDACGTCVCSSEPEEDWGIAEICLYDVGFPVNWRKVTKTNKEKMKSIKKGDKKRQNSC